MPESARVKMTRFAVRSCLFYAFVLTAWLLVRSYHDALVISFVITAGRVFTTLPPILPELMGDNTCCLHLGRITIQLAPYCLTAATPTFSALMMATSAVPAMRRMKATALGIGVLFCIQVLFVLFLIYDNLYAAYPIAVRKGIDMKEIFEYDPDRTGLLTTLIHLLLASDCLLPLCLWVVLVYGLKRKSGPSFPLALL